MSARVKSTALVPDVISEVGTTVLGTKLRGGFDTGLDSARGVDTGLSDNGPANGLRGALTK